MKKIVVLRGDVPVIVVIGKAVIRRVGNHIVSPLVVEAGRCIVDKPLRKLILLTPLGEPLEFILPPLIRLANEILQLQPLVVGAVVEVVGQNLGYEAVVVRALAAELKGGGETAFIHLDVQAIPRFDKEDQLSARPKDERSQPLQPSPPGGLWVFVASHDKRPSGNRESESKAVFTVQRDEVFGRCWRQRGSVAKLDFPRWGVVDLSRDGRGAWCLGQSHARCAEQSDEDAKV